MFVSSPSSLNTDPFLSQSDGAFTLRQKFHKYRDAACRLKDTGAACCPDEAHLSRSAWLRASLPVCC